MGVSRSENVRDKGQASADAVGALVGGAKAMLQPRQPADLSSHPSQRQSLRPATQQQPALLQPGASQAQPSQANQASGHAWATLPARASQLNSKRITA